MVSEPRVRTMLEIPGYVLFSVKFFCDAVYEFLYLVEDKILHYLKRRRLILHTLLQTTRF